MTKPKYKMQNTKTPYRPESEPEFEADRNRDPNQFPPPTPTPTPAHLRASLSQFPASPASPLSLGRAPRLPGVAPRKSVHIGDSAVAAPAFVIRQKKVCTTTRQQQRCLMNASRKKKILGEKKKKSSITERTS